MKAIIPAPRYCSFCSKSEHRVEVLIAEEPAYICNECVDLCNDIIAAKREATEGSKP